jgi:amidase
VQVVAVAGEDRVLLLVHLDEQVTGGPAAGTDLALADEDPWVAFRNAGRFTPFTQVANITGQPAVSVPLSWSDDGLPIGVQLVGRPADEATLFRVSAQLEQARPWRQRRPPVS